MTYILMLLLQLPFAHAEFCEDVLAEQQLRIETASRNIANEQTTRTPEGTPWAPLRVVCGLELCSVLSEPNFKKVFAPDHPDANREGYVSFPNIDHKQQMADLLAAKERYTAIRQGCGH